MPGCNGRLGGNVSVAESGAPRHGLGMDIIALDIETETGPCHSPVQECCARRGLDPGITPITVVSISDAIGATVLRSSTLGEAGLLRALDAALAGRSGYLVTWNGSAFDLPFIAERAIVCGVALGLEVVADASIEIKYQPLPGHSTAYRGRWHGLEHVDIQFAYKDLAEMQLIRWGLKPVANHFGLAPVEVDRLAMHELSVEELDEYVASDTRVTLELAMRIGDLTDWSDTSAFEDWPQ
jgi:hypothetical protein